MSDLRDQIERCWVPPYGAEDAVLLQFELDRSGELKGRPRTLNSGSTPEFMAAEASAINAVVRCAPYPLPAEKYETWKTVILHFDPREMPGF